MTQQELTTAFDDLFADYAQIKKAYTLPKNITDMIEENFLAWGAQVAKKVTLAADEIVGRPLSRVRLPAVRNPEPRQYRGVWR
jgi:hypothetical protein